VPPSTLYNEVYCLQTSKLMELSCVVQSRTKFIATSSNFGVSLVESYASLAKKILCFQIPATQKSLRNFRLFYLFLIVLYVPLGTVHSNNILSPRRNLVYCASRHCHDMKKKKKKKKISQATRNSMNIFGPRTMQFVHVDTIGMTYWNLLTS